MGQRWRSSLFPLPYNIRLLAWSNGSSETFSPTEIFLLNYPIYFSLKEGSVASDGSTRSWTARAWHSRAVLSLFQPTFASRKCRGTEDLSFMIDTEIEQVIQISICSSSRAGDSDLAWDSKVITETTSQIENLSCRNSKQGRMDLSYGFFRLHCCARYHEWSPLSRFCSALLMQLRTTHKNLRANYLSSARQRLLRCIQSQIRTVMTCGSTQRRRFRVSNEFSLIL